MLWADKNHAFFDGNKRIGIYAMLVFLELNGMEMECSEEELIALGLGIASGEIEEKDVDIWIVTHNRGECADKCLEKVTKFRSK